jgi:hypothetical protein
MASLRGLHDDTNDLLGGCSMLQQTPTSFIFQLYSLISTCRLVAALLPWAVYHPGTGGFPLYLFFWIPPGYHLCVALCFLLVLVADLESEVAIGAMYPRRPPSWRGCGDGD